MYLLMTKPWVDQSCSTRFKSCLKQRSGCTALSSSEVSAAVPECVEVKGFVAFHLQER
jgi:hypothetical protein